MEGSSGNVGDKMLETLAQRASGQKATAFYFRVLADDQLRSALSVNLRLLSPSFSSDGPKPSEDVVSKKRSKKSQRLTLRTSLPNTSSSPPSNATNTSPFAEENPPAPPNSSAKSSILFPQLRPAIEAGLILGAHSEEWTFRLGSTPGWKDPLVAKAFDQVATFLANEELPMTLRLALAAITCKKCGINTPPFLVENCANHPRSAWEQDQPVEKNKKRPF